MERQSNQGKYGFNVIYDEGNELGFMNVDRFKVDCEFYLIRDLKFFFMMVGQSGFSGGCCIFCKLKQYEWL